MAGHPRYVASLVNPLLGELLSPGALSGMKGTERSRFRPGGAREGDNGDDPSVFDPSSMALHSVTGTNGPLETV